MNSMNLRIVKMKFMWVCNVNRVQGLSFDWHAFQRLSVLLYSTSTSSTKKFKGNNPPCSSIAKLLVESLGFSTHQSLTISGKFFGSRRVIDSKILENAASVVNFYKQLGLQQSAIRRVIVTQPSVLGSQVETTLKLKTKLLSDLGCSGSLLALALTKNPRLLSGRLGPAIHALKTVLGSDANVVSMFTRSSRIDCFKIANYLVPNVDLLLNCYDIPRDKILKYIIREPNPFIARTHVFRDQLIRVEQKMGIPRGSPMFLYGLHMACLKEKTVEDKVRIFKSFGWTQSDVTALIRRNPLCFLSGEPKIRENLDFLMNEVGYDPSYLSSHPVLFTCSVKKRLLPRHKVLQVLKEKRLILKDYALASAVVKNNAQFLEKFVLPFEEVHLLYAQLTGFTVGSLTG